VSSDVIGFDHSGRLVRWAQIAFGVRTGKAKKLSRGARRRRGKTKADMRMKGFRKVRGRWVEAVQS
jgi:hypothetical protein